MLYKQSKKWKKALLVGLGLLCCGSVALAKEATVVGLGDDRESALDDAKRNAVEQVVGTMIDSRSMSEMAVVKLDEIYTKSRGFVKKITVLKEGPADGAYRVKARIDVDTDPNTKLMDQLTMLMMLNDPRIAVVIKYRPTGGAASDSHYVHTCQSIIYDKLLSEGFTHLVDYEDFQSGQEPVDQSGSMIDQTGSEMDESNLAISQSDLEMDQIDSMMDQTGSEMDQSDFAMSQGDLEMDQRDSMIDPIGSVTDQSDSAMGQSDLEMSQSDSTIDQLTSVMDQSYSATDQNDLATIQGGFAAVQNSSLIVPSSSAVDYLVIGQLSIRTAPILLPKYSDYTSETSEAPSVQTGLHKAAANMDAKIIKTDTREAISEFHIARDSIGNSENDAKDKAVANLAVQVAEAVKKSFARKGADVNANVRLIVRADAQEELLRLEKELKSLPGARGVIFRGYENGKGTFDVDTDMKPMQIYRRLQELGFNLFMEKASANVLEISI